MAGAQVGTDALRCWPFGDVGAAPGTSQRGPGGCRGARRGGAGAGAGRGARLRPDLWPEEEEEEDEEDAPALPRWLQAPCPAQGARGACGGIAPTAWVSARRGFAAWCRGAWGLLQPLWGGFGAFGQGQQCHMVPGGRADTMTAPIRRQPAWGRGHFPSKAILGQLPSCAAKKGAWSYERHRGGTATAPPLVRSALGWGELRGGTGRSPRGARGAAWVGTRVAVGASLASAWETSPFRPPSSFRSLVRARASPPAPRGPAS